jgi:hypothetical protein
MPTYYEGNVLTIKHTEDAELSLPKAEESAQLSCQAQLRRLTKRLADTGTLRSPQQFNNEGDGFYAIKARCGLRAYGWFSRRCRGVFYISHYVYKSKEKLSKKDKKKMKANRRGIEED